MRFATVLMAASLLVSGCDSSDPVTTGDGGSGTTQTTVQGVDFSGTYQLQDVECFDSSGNATAAETYSGYEESFTIIGNTLTAVDDSVGCTVKIVEHIVVSSSASQTGVAITNASVQSATSGSCTLNLALSGSSISPASANLTLSTGQALPNVNANYLWVSPYLGIPSNYSDGSGGICYIVFKKL